jgi:hypothetical protein
MSALHPFMFGILTAAAFTAAVFFLRFWTLTSDRLLLYFSLAFVALGLNWFALAMTDPASEDRYFVFLLRLLAFIFIIIGIVDKNRRAQRSPAAPRAR